MIHPHLSVWLAIAYAMLLLAGAWGFDITAKRTAKNALEWHNGGFEYQPSHDAWLCPEDQWLWPESFDPNHRLVRYRALPVVCNSCPVKSKCTVTDAGRTIEREIDPWPHSEAGRFHRGISCVVAIIAVLIPIGATVFFHTTDDLLILLPALVIFIMLSLPLAKHLWNTPVNFPAHLTELIPTDSSKIKDPYAKKG